MKKIKKVVIILIILLIIILILINGLIRALYLNEIEEAKDEISDLPEDFIEEIGIVDGYNTFFSVEKMLNKYIEAIKNKENKIIYNLIYNIIIKENEIQQENILEYVSDIAQYISKFKIIEMYQQKNTDSEIYYIKTILNNGTEQKEGYFVLYVDKGNSTYSVKIINEEIYENQKENWNKDITEKIITKNGDNNYIFVEPTEQERVYKYFEGFIENVLDYPEYAYELLDKEYKEIRFPTIEEFKNYIEENNERFSSYFQNSLKSFEEFENMDEYMAYVGIAKKLELEQYQIRMEEDYNKYICTDSERNYYTFYAKSPFQYTVILDNYTIPTEEFIETYNASKDAEKVVLNIKKFFMGIDDKNYGYSYNVLSEAFRNNNYQTKNDFINYAEQNFFKKNKIEYINYTEENGVYIYKIKISDKTGKSAETKQFNMIIRLKEGTDFEMSFSQI